MRYVTYVITPSRGYFDRGAERLREQGVTFESIRSIDQLTDGSIITQKVVRGKRADIQGTFEATGPEIIDYQLTDDGDTAILQLHYQPSDLTRELLAIHDRHAVVLEYPLVYTGRENRRLRLSGIGREETLRCVIEETKAIVDVEIEQVGSYDPSNERPLAELTDRQREVLRVAVEEGYYEEPRRVTYEDIAARLDCSAGTVGQHLRRIEAQLMPTVVFGSDGRSGTNGDRDPAPTVRHDK